LDVVMYPLDWLSLRLSVSKIQEPLLSEYFKIGSQ